MKLQNFKQFESMTDLYSDEVPMVNSVEEAEEQLKKIDTLEGDDAIVFGFDKYRFHVSINRKGYQSLMIAQSTPKARYSKYKIISNYYYPQPERLPQAVYSVINGVLNRKKAKADLAEKKRKIRENFKHDFKVGDILYSSFGYEQTNIDFFQVTKVGVKSIWLRPIKSKLVSHTGPYSADVAPAKDAFTGEEVRKTVLFNTYGGKTNYYVKSPSYSRYQLYKYDMGETGLHSSWDH